MPATLLCLATVLPALGADIRGRVTNAVGGEPLERVEIILLENKNRTLSSSRGEFKISQLPPGNYTLRLNAVGFRLMTIPLNLSSPSDVKQFEITMVPDNFHRTDRVEVHGDVFRVADSPAVTETTLTASEIRKTSTVFADDPFRAVQTLPGVSAEGNNEFFAEFSVMGALFSSVSVYIDDVLVENPFHEIGNFSEGASLGVMTSEVVEKMTPLPAAYPERFGDADGAALDLHTRDGSRSEPLFRISAGIAASEILGEGGLGQERKGSWLLSARKSYINYLIKNRVAAAADVGFEDADLKLTYDLSSRHNVSLFATDGHTNMTMNDPASLNVGEYASGNSDFTLVRAGWRWTLNPRLMLDARGAFIREPDQLFNNTNLLLTKTDHREWASGAGLSWAWGQDRILQAEWTERELRDSQHQTPLASSGILQAYSVLGTGLKQSADAQQAFTVLHGRAQLLASLRVDSMSGFAIHPFSPQISVAVHATHTAEFQLGAGRYRQISSRLQASGSFCTVFGLMPEQSDHFTAAIEQRLGENTRLRLEGVDRQDSWALGRLPDLNTGPLPLSACPSFIPVPNSTYQRDYSRGLQMVLQRRSANRLSGWLGYTLALARQRQYQVLYENGFELFPYDTPYNPTIDDQRHGLNLFAMYRLQPGLSLSGKFLYGSGFPIPNGTYALIDGSYVATGANTLRLGTYVRLDTRADKDWAFDHWKLTMYGEILNMTNHYNARYAYESGINPANGQATVKTLQGLPITPTAGLVLQF